MGKSVFVEQLIIRLGYFFFRTGMVYIGKADVQNEAALDSGS